MSHLSVRLSLALLLFLPVLFLDACWVTFEGDRFEGENPGDCTDDADNDADGFFDCDDPGCANSQACSSSDDDDSTDDDDSATDDDDTAVVDADGDGTPEDTDCDDTDPVLNQEDADSDGVIPHT